MLKRRKPKEEKPKRKKGASGKHKGGKFERQICKDLSMWYSKEKQDDLFWRTAGSGARATIRAKKNKCTANSCGDVGALDTKAQPFIDLCMIELKSGYSRTGKIVKNKNGKLGVRIKSGVSLTDLLDKVLKKNIKKETQPLLIQWIEKAKSEAQANNIPHPIVIFQRDRKRACIVLQKQTWNLIEGNNSSKWIFPNDGPFAHIHYNEHNFKVIPLEDFFAWCHPKAFFKKLPKVRRRRQWEKGKYAGKKIKNFKD